MKKIMMLIFLAIAGTSFSQTKEVVDSRLEVNFGDRIYQIYEKQRSYYDFLVWELDQGYEIVDLNTLKLKKGNLLSVVNISNITGEKFSVELLSKPSLFNFIEFNFKREKGKDVYYDLGNGTAMVFYSVSSVWNKYKKLNN